MNGLFNKNFIRKHSYRKLLKHKRHGQCGRRLQKNRSLENNKHECRNISRQTYKTQLVTKGEADLE